jgi:trimeric autotransporter adhesin
MISTGHCSSRRPRFMPGLSCAAALLMACSVALAQSPGSQPHRPEAIDSPATGDVEVYDPSSIAFGLCEPGWLPMFGGGPGVGNVVRALAVFDDGTGEALYVGGDFVTAGGVNANHIARWDGQEWTPLGEGMSSVGFAAVTDLVVFDDGTGPALYAAGFFTQAGGETVNRIARWDGEAWSPLGTGMDNAVQALAVFDDGSGPALYAGGWFTTAGGELVNHIARWDGEQWTGLSGGTDYPVEALTVFDDGDGPVLVAGGAFTIAGGISANRVATWDGGQWSALAGGVSATVDTLAPFNDGTGPALYAGGDFTFADGQPANFIARWDGSEWSDVDGGMDDRVRALMVFDIAPGDDPALHVGGFFTTAGGVSANRIARWDGNSWSALGDGMNASVLAFAEFDDGLGGPGAALFAGGAFTHAGEVGADRIARWDGSEWSALGADDDTLGPLNDEVHALIATDELSDSGENLFYVGGRFTSAGNVNAERIAKSDGESWMSLDTEMDSFVQSLAVFDDGTGPALYAGGPFTTAGGVQANSVAKWDGDAWSPLGDGVENFPPVTAEVWALLGFDDGSGDGPALFVAGRFFIAGGEPASHIATWDGQAWSTPGSGVGDRVKALAVFDDGSGPALYAGGWFTTAGGVEVNRVAKWDGEEWSSIGAEMDGVVEALTVFDDGSGPALYVGGWFTNAAGKEVNRIAKWDGKEWSALGTGTDAAVLALHVFDDGSGPALFAGGNFSVAGDGEVDGFARWDGETWTGPSEAVSGNIQTFATFDDGTGTGLALLAGGWFSVSAPGDAFLARWQGCPIEPECPPADLNCDGAVDVADLLILFDNWGACADCDDCIADLNDDCAVDVGDLLILFDNWG